ncbi:MAG: polyprenyl synthetase family protein [Stenotrophobium sp.]
MNSPTSFSDKLPQYHARLQASFERWLPAANHYPARLHEAMRYACAGGKRLRALLVYAAGDALNLPAATLDAPACAVELIHAYSLVHDDLPAMDDDALRRGQPTTHIAYDEATAILVGDALQALAFSVLAQAPGLSDSQRIAMVGSLAEAAGSRGMVGGQAIDLQSEGKALSLPELETLHIHKTGALIRACLQLACHAQSLSSPVQREALDRYGKCIGLAFQIQDDVLDIEGLSANLGKTAGKDSASLKSTYPALMGLPAAKQRAAELFNQARDSLKIFPEGDDSLLWLADHIQGRNH